MKYNPYTKNIIFLRMLDPQFLSKDGTFLQMNTMKMLSELIAEDTKNQLSGKNF